MLIKRLNNDASYISTITAMEKKYNMTDILTAIMKINPNAEKC